MATVSIRKFRIIVLVSNRIEYWSNYLIRFEISNIRTALLQSSKKVYWNKMCCVIKWPPGGNELCSSAGAGTTNLWVFVAEFVDSLCSQHSAYVSCRWMFCHNRLLSDKSCCLSISIFSVCEAVHCVLCRLRVLHCFYVCCCPRVDACCIIVTWWDDHGEIDDDDDDDERMNFNVA